MPTIHSRSACRQCDSKQIETSALRGIEHIFVCFIPLRPVRCGLCLKRFWVWESFTADGRRIGCWSLLLVAPLFWLFWNQWPMNVSNADGFDIQQDLFQGYVEAADDTSVNDDALLEEVVEQIAEDEQVIPIQAQEYSSNEPDTASPADQSPPAIATSTQVNLAAPKLPRATDLSDDVAIDSEELRSLLKVDINFVIEQWRQAWQQGDSQRYLSFYSDQFIPAGNATLQEWRLQRQSKIVANASIKLELSDFEVDFDEQNTKSVVRFNQQYHSDSYRDQSRKELTLVKEQDVWRIISERSLSNQ